MYGPLDRVGMYKTGEVLFILGMDLNEQALLNATQHHYSRIKEAKARNKPKR